VTPPPLTSLDSALAVLTAMITPALLISACGTFILSTSNRLGRIIDRVRRLSDGMEALVRERGTVGLLEERRRMLGSQVVLLSRRAELLQAGLLRFYVASGIFVAASVGLGAEALTGLPPGWVQVVLALLGASVFFTGAVSLIREGRVQRAALAEEMLFLRVLVEHHSRRVGELASAPPPPPPPPPAG
jgi:hypothetical protein